MGWIDMMANGKQFRPRYFEFVSARTSDIKFQPKQLQQMPRMLYQLSTMNEQRKPNY